MTKSHNPESWWVYIVQCADGTYYTGTARDLAHRLVVHNAGKGAKYTRGRLPVTLVYSESQLNHSQALKRELQLKKLTRLQKERLAVVQSRS